MDNHAHCLRQSDTLNQIHKNHLPARVWSGARPVGNRRTAVSSVWVDLVIRSAGHQTSLFSIRPPEGLHRASLEGASTKPRAAARGSWPPAKSCPRFHSDRLVRSQRCGSRSRPSRAIQIHVFDPIRLSMIHYDSRSEDKYFISNENRCAESIDSRCGDGNE